jgi:hypothetical protein
LVNQPLPDNREVSTSGEEVRETDDARSTVQDTSANNLSLCPYRGDDDLGISQQ